MKLENIWYLPFLFYLLILSTGKITASEKTKKPLFLLKDSIWKSEGDISRYYDFLKNQGLDGVLLEVMDPQKNFYFASPELSKMKWTKKSNLLENFGKLWEEIRSGGESGLIFSADLSLFSRGLNGTGEFGHERIPKGDLKLTERFIAGFFENYNFDMTTAEPLQEKIQSTFFWNHVINKRKCNMILYPQNFSEWQNYFLKKDGIKKSAHQITLADFRFYPANQDQPAPTFLLGDFLFSIGKMNRRECWIQSSMSSQFEFGLPHNVLLYRTVQYAPDGYIFNLNYSDINFSDPGRFLFERDLKKEILEFYPSEKKGTKKPVCNLVFYKIKNSKIELPQMIEPMMNGLLSNGYEIRPTFDEIAEGADLYYIVVCQKNVDPDFEAKLTKLLDVNQSHFYGTCVIHPLSEITKNGLWKKIRSFFKIPPSEEGWIPDMPETVRFTNHSVKWKAPFSNRAFGMNFIRERSVFDYGGEVVLSELFKNQTFALILKSGKHYLINGNCLHLESGFFINQIVGKTLLAPITAYVTSSRKYATALAISDTNLKIRIPASEVTKDWKIVLFDSEGRRTRSEVIRGKENFESPLKSRELIILQTNE